jgi:flagellar hook-basal body complex protein FliE
MSSVEAISFLPAVSMPSLAVGGDATAQAPGAAFGTWFESHLSELNDKLLAADAGVQKLAAGDVSNLHDVMISLQEAHMSLQLMMQVRNHLLDAYHDIAQMQL